MHAGGPSFEGALTRHPLYAYLTRWTKLSLTVKTPSKKMRWDASLDFLPAMLGVFTLAYGRCRRGILARRGMIQESPVCQERRYDGAFRRGKF